MNIQYCRGCPLTVNSATSPRCSGEDRRSKTKEQLIAELDSLYARGWRGAIFFVDDNFIGDKGKLKGELLPAMIDWMTRRGTPSTFTPRRPSTWPTTTGSWTDGQVRVRGGLYRHRDPLRGSHAESGKVQNRNCDLLASVKRIQRAGLQVHGGFIVGFDSDPPSIFDK